MNNSITPVSNSTLAGAAAAAGARLPVQTLGQDDFLKLLVAQMTSQDPLNPQTDGDFIAQMAQFSALEQAKDLSAQMGKLEADQQLLQAAALLGRTVTLQTGSSTPAQGVVTSVHIEAGIPKLEVGGALYDLSQVISIEPAPALPPTPLASGS